MGKAKAAKTTVEEMFNAGRRGPDEAYPSIGDGTKSGAALGSVSRVVGRAVGAVEDLGKGAVGLLGIAVGGTGALAVGTIIIYAFMRYMGMM